MQPENTQQRADNSLARQNTHPHGKQINRPKFERGRNNRQPENHPASRAPAKNAKAVASRALTPNRPGFAKVSTDKRQPENECTRFQAAFFADKHLNVLDLNAPANRFRWMGEQRLGFIEATSFQAAYSRQRQPHQPLTNQYASIQRSAIQPSLATSHRRSMPRLPRQHFQAAATVSKHKSSLKTHPTRF